MCRVSVHTHMVGKREGRTRIWFTELSCGFLSIADATDKLRKSFSIRFLMRLELNFIFLGRKLTDRLVGIGTWNVSIYLGKSKHIFILKRKRSSIFLLFGFMVF